MKKLLFVVAMLFAASAAATEPYVGASLGRSKASGFCDGSAGTACSEDSSAWKIFGGVRGKVKGLNVGAEIGYADLGKVEASLGSARLSVRTSAFDGTALIYAPFGSNFSGFARAGLYSASSRGDSNVGVSASSSNSGFTFGAGVLFEPTPRFGVRAEWQRYSDVGDDYIGRANYDFFGVSVLFKF